jgi:lipid-A-disaccharide synthase
MNTPNLLIISAEASSVLYAERLLEYWKQNNIRFNCFGVGSQKMESLGFRILGRSEEMAVMGFYEVLTHYSAIRNVFHKVLDEVDIQKPTVALLLDYPGFNLKLAKELHQRGVKVLYYIAPQVWAWKQKRVFSIKKYVTKVLTILPFEKEFFDRFEVPNEFVGHPLLDEIDEQMFDAEKIKLQRSKMGIPLQNTVLGLMPGSRLAELEHCLPIQIQVARRLYAANSNLTVMVLVAPNYEKEDIADRLSELKIPYILIKKNPFEMIALTDTVLVTSGTATLMVGLMHKPMVIMYKTSFLTAFIVRKMFKGFFGLVNLIMGEMIVPEILQEQATANNIFNEMQKYFNDKNYEGEKISQLKKLQGRLGDRGATRRVSKIVEGYIND